MLKAGKGSFTGIDLVEFECGKQYEVTDRLFDVFVNQMGIAVSVEEEPMKPIEKPEQKSISESPQNKAISFSPSNKKSKRFSRKNSRKG